MANDSNSIKFSSVVGNICRVEEFIQKIFTFYSISDVFQGRITTVIVEAVNNAILYGNISNPKKFVTIEFRYTNYFYEFVVEDEGDGFDYTYIPNPTLPENLEKEGGRGLFLITTLADDVVFEKGGSKIIIRFANNIKDI